MKRTIATVIAAVALLGGTAAGAQARGSSWAGHKMTPAHWSWDSVNARRF